MIFRIFFLFFLVVSVNPLFAWKKHQQVNGTIVSVETGIGVSGAKIVFKGVTNKALSYEATTDGKGAFQMPPKILTDSKVPYKYKVSITANNYFPVSVEISVSYGSNPINLAYKLNRQYKKVSLVGSIKDETSRVGISGATLTIKNLFNSKSIHIKSDTNGKFMLSNVITDPEVFLAHEYKFSISAPFYEGIELTKKVSPLSNGPIDIVIKRDLRKQKVRASVYDFTTNEKLSDVSVSVFSDQTKMKKSTYTTDAQGVIDIPEGLLTDTMPTRAYTYSFEISAEKYISKKIKQIIHFKQSEVSLFSFALKKENLSAPIIVEPRKTVLSLRPEILIDIPKNLRENISSFEFSIVNTEEPKKKIINKNIKEFILDKGRYFLYKLTDNERLQDGYEYSFTVKFITKDGFTTAEANQIFAIPSSDSLNPPFPEHEITADEEYINFQPAWCIINGISMILFSSNQGEEEESNPFQIWKVKPGSQSIGKVTESIRGSQAYYPVQGPGSKSLSYISDHIAETYNLFSQPKDGMLVTQMTQYSKGEIAFPSIAKDGTQIAFVKISSRKPKGTNKVNSSIWMMDNQGRNLTRLCIGTMPRYSPDGKYILYISGESGNREVWRIGTDGTGKTMLTRSAEDKFSPDWIDNNKIVYVSSKANNKDIWMKDLKGNAERQLTNNLADETTPACSDDGRVAFVSNRKGGKSLNIYYIDISATLEQASSDRLK